MAKKKHGKASDGSAGGGAAEAVEAKKKLRRGAQARENREDRQPEREPQGVGAAAEDGPGPRVEIRAEESELETAKREAASNYDRFLRTRAELDNVLKRHQRERSDQIKYAAEALARDLLSTVDDLERALEHAGEDDGGAGVTEGVELVLKGLLGVLERHGIERIDAVGKPFDPSEHEAVITVETAEVEPNTVVTQHRSGFRLHDRLLRAAMVAVAKAPCVVESLPESSTEQAETGDNGDN